MAGFAAFVIALAWVLARKIGFASASRRRLARILGVAIVASPLAIWAHALLSYFCIDTQGVVLHAPFVSPVRYGWTDVSAATPACSSRGRRQVTESIFSVTLDLAEGRTVTLHFPASRLRQHPAELIQVFSRLPRGPGQARRRPVSRRLSRAFLPAVGAPCASAGHCTIAAPLRSTAAASSTIRSITSRAVGMSRTRSTLSPVHTTRWAKSLAWLAT